MEKLNKFLATLVGMSLVIGLMGSFAFAAEKELTPYEWSRLSDEDKLAYKTVVIRGCLGTGSWMEEEKRDKFNEIMDLGDTSIPAWMYSKTLFQLTYPNIKVKQIDFDYWRQDLVAAMAGGMAPSCFGQSAVGGPIAGIEEGILADITDLVEDWELSAFLKANYWDLWKMSWKDGRCYGIPWGGANSQMILFRKDWFKEAGIFNEKGEPRPSDNWTWDDFQDIAVKLTNVKEQRWGFAYAASDISRVDQVVIRLVASFGVFDPLCFTAPDKSGKYTLQATLTPQLKKALQFFRDLRFKYDCMLTGTEITFHGAFSNEVEGGRAGMAAMWEGNYLGNAVGSPYRLSPTIPYVDIIGQAVLPRGPYDMEAPLLAGGGYGFDPTLSKEELKAAFLWETWILEGRGREIMLEQAVDQAIATGWKTMPGAVSTKLMYYFPHREIPGLPPVEEYTSAEIIRVYEQSRKVPNDFPEPFEYGLEISVMGTRSAEELPLMNSLLQGLVLNADTTVEAEFAKAADMLNKIVYNYKIKDGEEKIKAWVDALTSYYKKHYPEYYESKDFEEQLSYYKVQ